MYYLKLRMTGISWLVGAIVLAFLVAGCVNPEKDEDGNPVTPGQKSSAGGKGAKVVQPPPFAEVEATLNLAGQYYDQGNYPAVIGILSVNTELPKSPVTMQIRAKKMIAFSHCNLGRPLPCQKNFEEILELDPQFELTSYEAGNPLWEPAFRRAKKTAPRKGG